MRWHVVTPTSDPWVTHERGEFSRREAHPWGRRLGWWLWGWPFFHLSFLPSVLENPFAWCAAGSWEKHRNPILPKRKWRSLRKVCPRKLNWMPWQDGEAQGRGRSDLVTEDVRPGGQGNTGSVHTCVAKRWLPQLWKDKTLSPKQREMRLALRISSSVVEFMVTPSKQNRNGTLPQGRTLWAWACVLWSFMTGLKVPPPKLSPETCKMHRGSRGGPPREPFVGGRSRNGWKTVGRTDSLLPFVTGGIVVSWGGSCVAEAQSWFYPGEWASSTNDFLLLRGIITVSDVTVPGAEIRSEN